MHSQPINDSGATNPLSSGFLERYFGSSNQGSDATNPFTNSLQAPPEAPGQPSDPIGQLQRTDSARQVHSAQDIDRCISALHAISNDLDCRLLFIPAVPNSLTVTGGGDWISLRPHDFPPMQGLTIRQGPEDVGCTLQSPVQCGLYYDTTKDHILLMNFECPLNVQRLVDLSGNPTRGAIRTIGAFEDFSLEPGVWRLSPGRTQQEQRACAVRVYCRSYSLAVCRREAPAPFAGRKRLLSGDLVSTESEASHEASRPLASPADLQDGEIALVASNSSSYSLFRMRRLSNTRAACLFEARHSGFGEQVIVVKSLRFQDERDVPYKAQTWEREYKIHSQLQSDKIVELLGADARLSSLYLRKVDAYDLSHRNWCKRASDCKFTGTQDDARRVLVDMATALVYLREQRVVHNDIKPSNILYRRDTGAVLIDFGLGTMNGSRACTGGTPWYVAPEYYLENIRTGLSDVWALGVVIIFLLKKIPLPDSQLQVKQWVIYEAGVESNEASERAKSWQAIVEDTTRTMRNGVAGESSGMILEKLAARMLAMKPENRLSQPDLMEAVQSI